MSNSVDMSQHHEISMFYFKEARLFSNASYREWLEQMVSPDVHYTLPIFENRYRSDRRPPSEFMPAIYDDSYRDLDQRIEQLETNLSRRIDPPERIRHLITNIEAFHSSEPDEFDTFTNFVVCRNRREREESILIGGREDRLRKENGSYRLVRRKVIIPQRVILDADLYYMM